MGTTVDSLDIQIAAQAGKANQSLDALVRRLDKITSSLTRAGGTGMNQMAVGVSRLSSAMQKMNAIGTADFTRLANNMSKLSAVDAGKLRSSAVAIGGLTKSLSNLSNVRVSDNAKQISDLAHGIAQLGYKSATQAIQNIPKLAISMRDLMTTLSGAPRVSQNLIDMTNALARLARTGSSSGRAATSLSSALNTYSRSTTKAKKHTFSLASAIGKVYATYWLLFRAFGKLKDAIDISSQLTEVQNVVSTTFGEYSGLVDQMASTSITELGMSELTVKQIASRYQAMGSAMGFARGEMADMSLELTRLAADMASFYNVEQKDVAEDLAAIFTGETRPLRSYGIDLTQATLAEWAMKQGLDANIQSMSQAEKAMLRYQYVMANTTAAQGDFAKTSNTWANQTRILAQNFQSLGSIIGGVLINAFKPLVSGLNSVMSAVISTAETIANALGAIFGWTIEIFPSGSVADDYTSGLDGVADSANNASGGLGNAADKAKELKRALMGFDEIEKLPDDTGSSGSGGSGGGSGGGGAGSGNGSGGATAAIVPTESLFEKYKSDIKTLEQLGEYISDSLTKAMNNIKWSKIYGKAINFGTGLASFLNGLISPELFGATATTIANSLNTALFALNSFGDTFEWDEFGLSLAESVKVFFKDFKWNLAADTFNTLADGILTSILTAAEKTDWAYLGGRIVVFISGINWKNLFWKIGQIIWEVINGAIETAATVFEADGIENKIAGVILGLKFLGIGATFGSKVWGVITKSILGKGVTDLAAKTIGSHISKSIGDSLTSSSTISSLTASANSFGILLGGALFVAIAQVAANEITGGPEALVEDIRNKLDEALNKEEWKFGIPALKSFSEKLRNLFGGDSFWSKNENDTTPEIEVEITTKDNTPEGITSARKNIESLPNETAVDVDANTEPAEKRVNILGNQLEKSGFKVPIKSEGNKKYTIKPLEAFFKKNPVEASTTVNEKTTQENLDRLKNLKLGAAVETTTTAPVLQSALNQLVKTFGFRLPVSISTSASVIQREAQGKLNGFNASFNATANVTGKKMSSTFDYVLPGMTAEVSRKKYGDKFSYLIEGMTGVLKKKSYASGFSKTIYGITAFVNKLEKKNGLTLSLVAGLSVVGGLLKMAFTANGGVFTANGLKPITAYAGGGLPDIGQMFIAREAGPELVGTLGGHTAVMNNDQIVASVSAGVFQAVKAAMSGDNSRNLQVNVVLEGDAQGLFRTVQQENNRIVMATGKPALLT